MGKTAGPLAPIKTVEPNYPSNPVLFTMQSQFSLKKKKKKCHFHLRMSLIKKKKNSFLRILISEQTSF